MKRVISLLLVLIMIIACWGCSAKNHIDGTSSGTVPSAPKYNINLAYCDNDYMNPYTCVTKVNRMLTPLVYESLVGINNEYETVNILADKVEYNDGVISVKLKENVVFSDGTPLTSADVKYSFDLAKKQEYVFSSEISTIKSCTVVDNYNLAFNIGKKDPFAENLLTFPVIKSGSDKLESSDNLLYDPIGTGRYVRNGFTLVANGNYRSNDTKLENINLINTPDNEALNHSIQAGRISVFYSDLADGEIPKMMGKSLKVSLPNLVYIGFNDASGPTVDPEIRQIVSAVLDRKVICEYAFMNYAEPAAGLYPVDFSPAEGLQTILPNADIDNILAKLAAIGYNDKDKDGYYCNEKGRIISLDILVNEDSKTKNTAAQLIATQLENAGIKVNLVYKSYENYIKALNQGNFHLYIGEIHFKDNLDVSQLLVSGGSAAFGVEPSVTDSSQEEGEIFAGTTQDRVVDFYESEALFSDILIYFMSELPVIPVAYRSGWLGFNAELPDGILKPWITNPYNGIWFLG